MKHQFARVAEAIQAVAAGGVVIVVDAEEREDEGDLVAAAEHVTAEIIHLMTTQGRGLLCVPVAAAVAQRLWLPAMVRCDETARQAAFTVSVDHRDTRTGVSPEERAYTIRAISDPFSRPRDFLRPGHVFPLVARQRGVLIRSGHTEAAVDLARLAGLRPAGVLCEICSRDGVHMASRSELFQLASELKVPIIRIDDLIQYRLEHDSVQTVMPAS